MWGEEIKRELKSSHDVQSGATWGPARGTSGFRDAHARVSTSLPGCGVWLWTLRASEAQDKKLNSYLWVSFLRGSL